LSQLQDLPLVGYVMGQKSLNFSVRKCLRPPYDAGASLCEDQAVYQTNRPCSKLANGPLQQLANQEKSRLNSPIDKAAPTPPRITTEELLRWCSRFNKAKIAARKHHDLRREVLLHNAFHRAQSELKLRQEERQRRWKELKPLFHLETSLSITGGVGVSPPAVTTIEMAAVVDKMAPDNKLADEVGFHRHMPAIPCYDDDMEIERPSTPLPSTGPSKRQRCGCSPYSHCLCTGNDSSQLTKKCRSSHSIAAAEDDEDLQSLDRFLASLHCNTRQIG